MITRWHYWMSWMLVATSAASYRQTPKSTWLLGYMARSQMTTEMVAEEGKHWHVMNQPGILLSVDMERSEKK